MEFAALMGGRHCDKYTHIIPVIRNPLVCIIFKGGFARNLFGEGAADMLL